MSVSACGSKWKVEPLGQVVDILDSQRVPVNSEHRKNRVGRVPYYGATGQVGWIDNHLFDEELVLLGEDGAPFLDSKKPKAYLIRGKSWVNNHAHVLRAKPGLLNSFLLYQLNCTDYRPYVSGTTRLKLPQGPMKQIPLLIPDEDEQREIVAEIEKQFTRLEAGVAGLRRVQANLKRYRAAVLKAACEGKLVPTEAELARQEGRALPAPRPGVFYVYAIRCDNDSIYIGQTQDLQKRWKEHLAGRAADWTGQHKPVLIVHYEEYSSREEAVAREKWLKTGFGRKWIKREIAAGRARQAGYETGAQLLERIRSERREKWSGKGKYKVAAKAEMAELPSAPGGWTWATVEELAAPERNSITDGPFGSNLKTEHYTAAGPRVIRLQNIGDGVFVDEYAHISEEHFARLLKHSVFPGDLVIGALGENPPRSCLIPATLGRAIVKADCIRYKPHSNIAVRYINYVLNAEPTRKRTKTIVHGVGRPRLNLGEIKSIVVPFPPLAEQQRIVAEVERRLSVVEELESVVNANLQRAIRLRQAILQRAFEGKLAS